MAEILKVHNYPIQKKLTWMNMLVSGAALIVASTAFVAYELSNFRENMVRSLSIQAQIVGSNCASALAFNSPEDATNTLSGLKAAPNVDLLARRAELYYLRGDLDNAVRDADKAIEQKAQAS